MTGWLSWNISSERIRIAVTAIVSGTIAATVLLSYQRIKRDIKARQLKESIPLFNNDDGSTINLKNNGALTIKTSVNEDAQVALLAKRTRKGDYNEELILEQLARNRVFLKDEGLSKLRGSYIVVVGCGGVGSHAAAALARSGVSALRLIDFDQVTLSSLNRHAVATLADVGTPKVRCLQKRLEQITPWVRFDCRIELFSADKANDQLGFSEGRRPDYIIDAIDNIDSKVALIQYCHEHSIPVISSMGAACKSDPTRVFVGDISTCTEDPLSRATRRRLRTLGVGSGIPVVFSSEKTGPGKAQLLPLPEEEFERGPVNELGVLPDFRVRILPVLGTMPAFFGLCVANHVILEISGYPHEYTPFKAREKMYEGILATLQGQEEKMVRFRGEDALGLRIPVTFADVGYLIEEVFRGRSVVSGLGNRLALVRWRSPALKILNTDVDGQKCARLSLMDLVCMTKEEASRHEKLVLIEGKAPEDVYDSNVVSLVKSRLKEEAVYEKYR